MKKIQDIPEEKRERAFLTVDNRRVEMYANSFRQRGCVVYVGDIVINEGMPDEEIHPTRACLQIICCKTGRHYTDPNGGIIEILGSYPTSRENMKKGWNYKKR